MARFSSTRWRLWLALAIVGGVAALIASLARPSLRDVELLDADRSSAPIAAPAAASAPAAVPEAPTSRQASRPAWVVEGIVSGARLGPLAGARVRLVATRDDVATIAEQVVTAADGAFLFDLVQWRDADPPPRLVLSARATGHHPAGARLPALPPASEATLRLRSDLVLEPGAILTGRVVDAERQPVRGATVRLASSDRTWSRDERTDAVGGFLFASSTGPCVLHAWHDRLGTSERKALELRADVDHDVGDLDLAAAGTIRAQLVYRDGQPVAELSMELRGPSRPGPMPTPHPALSRTRARTGRDGRFLLRTLVPGAWSIECLGMGMRDLGCVTSDDEQRIVVEKHRLRLRCLDRDGAPLLPAARGVRLLWGVWRLDSDPRHTDLDNEHSGGQSGPITDLFVRSGSWCRLRLEADGASVSELLRIPADRNETPVVLRLNREELTAGIVTRITAPNGDLERWRCARLEPLVADAFCRIELAEKTSAYRMRNDSGLRDVVRYRATPGRARLTIEAGTDEAWTDPWLPIVRELDLAAHYEVLVEEQLRAGGRVQLTVRVPGDVAGLEMHGLVVTAAAGAGAAPVPLGPFGVRDVETAPWRAVAVAASGRAFLCQRILEPGDWTLRVTADGFAPANAAVTVRAGVASAEAWLAR